MDDTFPIIITGPREQRTESMRGRLIWAFVAIACLVLLIRAATLTPSPTGVGTHTALGLSRCAFLDRTGIPCPGCGMTTSFAWFTRGNIAASIYVQPMGAFLAFVAASGVWIGLYIAITARPAYVIFTIASGSFYFWTLMIFGLAAWIWKILIHLKHWDGWR